MSRKMVVTGPQRLQVVDEIEQFVEEKKWVGINDLSTCLRRIVVGSDLKVKPSSVGIGTLILNFLKPYDEVLPQMLRWINDPDEPEFRIGDYNEEIGGRHGRTLENLAVSEAFAMDVMKAVAANCCGFGILDRGTPQAKLVGYGSSNGDGTGTTWLVSFDKFVKP